MQITNRYDVKSADLLTEFLTSNSRNWVTEFETKFLEKIPGNYAIAVNSATSGLHAALYALGVTKGDEVISPGLTVVMDAYATIHMGATPIFADVDLDSHNISADSIEKCISKKTKAIIIVDWQGLPCDYKKIKNISIKYNIPVICDSAQTLLGRYEDKICGDDFDIHVYSFEQKKHMTTGSEGGMVVTKSPEIAERVRKFAGIGYKHLSSSAGRTSLSKSVAQNPSYKRFDTIGLNYRMNEISAVMGISQLERLDALIENRKIVANEIINVLKSRKSFVLQNCKYNASHTYYTVGALYIGESVSWEDIYNAYSATGAEPFYAAVSNPYLEPTLINSDIGPQNYSYGLCPNAEYIQKRLMAFKTNYITVEAARDDAQRLRYVLDTLNID